MPNLLQILIQKLKILFNIEIDETTLPSIPAPEPQPSISPLVAQPESAPPAAMTLPSLDDSVPEAAIVIDLGDAPPQIKPKNISVRNKIGFHTGPGGNKSGLGDWMRSLDKAGIPFMIKSVDSYGPVFEASELAKKSGVEHVLVYRISKAGQNDGYDYDVPPYKDPIFVDDPEGGAEKHWKKTLKKIPPEFDKERTWIEPINEVDVIGWADLQCIRLIWPTKMATKYPCLPGPAVSRSRKDGKNLACWLICDFVQNVRIRPQLRCTSTAM